MPRITYLIAFVLLVMTGSNQVMAQDSNALKKFDKATTALLITDPQNDFLKPGGVAYELVKENLKELNTVENIGLLLKNAKAKGYQVFISPHLYFPHDKHWHHRGALQQTISKIDMFKVKKPFSFEGLQGSGADFLEQYKPYILDGKTVITSPHKVYGPDSNDLVLQLHKRGVQTVILGGMAANLCVDSHMRELIENGFQVVMVKDAVGAPGKEAYQAALTNYNLIANHVATTKQILAAF